MIRALGALAALVVAGLLVAVAIDAGRWEHSGSRRPATLVGGVAEQLLGTSDDVALRRAVLAFVAAENTPYGFDNGQNQTRVRAQAESQLASVASTTPSRLASQADDLLGVLAWGSTTAPTGVLDPADRAVDAFTQAAQLDPANGDATFNLEVALRALESRSVRSGPSPNAGTHGLGRNGAGAGTPGEGY